MFGLRRGEVGRLDFGLTSKHDEMLDRLSLVNDGLAEAMLEDKVTPEIIRKSLLSPRLAGSYLLDKEGNTKVSAGIGIFYDETNMVLISRPFEGRATRDSTCASGSGR